MVGVSSVAEKHTYHGDGPEPLSAPREQEKRLLKPERSGKAAHYWVFVGPAGLLPGPSHQQVLCEVESVIRPVVGGPGMPDTDSLR